MGEIFFETLVGRTKWGIQYFVVVQWAELVKVGHFSLIGWKNNLSRVSLYRT